MSEYHTDYIKTLCYSEDINYLYSGGLDGQIISTDINQCKKVNTYEYNKDNVLLAQSNSVYSIDCDKSGNILIASIYENVNFYNSHIAYSWDRYKTKKRKFPF